MQVIVTEIIEQRHIIEIDDDVSGVVDFEDMEHKLNQGLKFNKDSEKILEDCVLGMNENLGSDTVTLLESSGQRTAQFNIELA